MHRIDNATAIDERFNDNLSIQNPGTQVTAAWANDVQENLVAPIEFAGIPLVKGEGGQLLAAIGWMIDQVVPIGSKIEIDGPNESAWLLELNTEYLKADFPRLVAFYTDQGRLIAGSDADHFRTPNYEGRFSRATSSDNTVDPDGPRDEGSLQADEFKSHFHSNSPTPSDSEGGAARPVTGNSGTSETLLPWNTGSAGGAETRPKNVALRWVIRGK